MIRETKTYNATLWDEETMIGRVGPYKTEMGLNGLVSRCQFYIGQTMHEVSDGIKMRLGIMSEGAVNYVDTTVYGWNHPVTYWEIEVRIDSDDRDESPTYLWLNSENVHERNAS